MIKPQPIVPISEPEPRRLNIWLILAFGTIMLVAIGSLVIIFNPGILS